MAKTNKLIEEKLEKFPPEVRELASRALEYAESDPQQLVTEKLKSAIRRIMKAKEGV
jgi:hypothetical protein